MQAVGRTRKTDVEEVGDVVPVKFGLPKRRNNGSSEWFRERDVYAR